MNEQQQYEKHLAEKFQQLPTPDAEPNWQQMKLLLDKEMPRGGGYWRWVTGIGILLLMLGGTWFFISYQDAATIADAGVEKPAKANTRSTLADTAAEKFLETDVQKSNKPSSPFRNSPDQTDGRPSNDLIKAKNIEENLHKNSRSKTSDPSHRLKEQAKDAAIHKARRDEQGTDPDAVEKDDSDSQLETGRLIASGKRKLTDEKYADKAAKNPNPVSGNHPYVMEDVSVKNSAVRYTARNTISDFQLTQLLDDSIRKNYVGIFPEAVVDNQKKSGKVADKTKSAKSNALKAVENRTLAVGLSLPMGFPLGDQKPGAYNINAKPNTISDFLPVPHLQYHINNKVYLQTELQLMNPQFIQPVLLYQNKTPFPGTTTIHYNSVYAKKLYYFNIPVGIHYSPFPHFYLGTGLQFSSLISGVAMHEETSFVIGSGTNNLLSQRYTKFKNDTVSNRIDNSEFRLMLDANYYWKQFTVGLRYNQALSNYVSFRLNPVSPLFQDKNKSLQFYLRYNLWEDYKKK